MRNFLTISTATIALWAISTFFISNQTQEEFQHYIDRSNKLYGNNGFKLTLSDYQKSFLTSTATIEIDFLDQEIAKEFKKDYILPAKIHYDIEHGPLFLKNGFGVGLSKISNNFTISSLLQPKTKKEFLELVKDDINLKTNMVISFAKELQYTLQSDAVHINQDKRDFNMSPLKLVGTTNIQSFKGDGKLAISQIEFKEKSSTNGVKLTDFLIEMKVDEIIEENIIFGNFKFSVANLLIKDNLNPIKTINATINGVMSSERESETTMNSSFQGDIDFKDTKLPDDFKELQKIHVTMNMKDLGIKGLSEFQKVAQTAQEEQRKLLEQLQNSKSKAMQPLFEEFNKIQEKMLSNLVHSLNALLIKDKTSIAYTINADTKDNSSSSAEVEVGYTGDMEFKGTIEELTKKVQSQLLSLIRLNVDIELNKKHIKLLSVPMLKQQLQMGVAQGFVKENNSSYTLNGYYKDRELIVNDNNLTSTVLPLLMMLTAQ